MLDTLATESQEGQALNLRVLIAEDQPDVARSFAVLLRQHGCEVQECHSGLSAITMAPLFMPEIMLLDVGLPGLNGFEVAQHLVQEMGSVRPYMIAISAYTQDRFRQQADEAGIDLYLTKPVSRQELIDHVVQWRDG
jgi:two-component system CheB/CheR fusion protein